MSEKCFKCSSQFPRAKCDIFKFFLSSRNVNAFAVIYSNFFCKLCAVSLIHTLIFPFNHVSGSTVQGNTQLLNQRSLPIHLSLSLLSHSYSASQSETPLFLKHAASRRLKQQQRKLLPFSTAGTVEKWWGTYQKLCLDLSVPLGKPA